MSGPGLRNYRKQRDGEITHDIEAGHIAFVIVTDEVLESVYKNERLGKFLPERDVRALQTNFLKHSENIYILGREICPQRKEQQVQIYRRGSYSLEGGDLVIDKQHLSDGNSIFLSAGTYAVNYGQGGCIKLWGLNHVPVLPESFLSGPIGGGY